MLSYKKSLLFLKILKTDTRKTLFMNIIYYSLDS